MINVVNFNKNNVCLNYHVLDSSSERGRSDEYVKNTVEEMNNFLVA